jgi:hypothetical protein
VPQTDSGATLLGRQPVAAGLPLIMSLIGVGALAVPLLGPLGFDVLTYHVSSDAVEQIRGGDIAGLLLVGPVSLGSAWLLRRGHGAGPAVALAPASYGLYMYAQLAISGDLTRYPGNSERFFPLLGGLVILCLAAVVLAGIRVARDVPPRPRPRFERGVGWYLLAVALFLTVGLHLPGLWDAWRDNPTSEEYLADPGIFWVVKLMDLAFVVPVVATVGIALLRGRPWARCLMAPLLGWSALLGSSVAGMGLAMVATDSAGASAGLAAGFTLVAVAALALAATAYRPLLTHGAG